MKGTQSDWIVAFVGAAMTVGLSVYLYSTFVAEAAIVGAMVDSSGYYKLGESIWEGHNPSPGRLAIRGYLYPIISIGLFRITPVLFVLVQFIAVALGLVFLMRLERRLHGQAWVTPFALLSVSLLLSPLHLMTEAFAFFLGAGAQLAFSSKTHNVWGVALLVIAALIKPAFFPVAFLSAVLSLRRNRESLWVALVIAALILPQLISTYSLSGQVTFSTAGQVNLKNRFYPAVYGMVESGEFVSAGKDLAKQARQERPEISQQLAYLAWHPWASVKTWGTILWKYHLVQTSGYVPWDNAVANDEHRKIVKNISGFLNILFVLLLVPAFWGTIVFVSHSPVFVWPVALVGPSLLLSAPMVYYQGDRIIFVALLLMLPLAGLGLRHFGRFARGRFWSK